MNDTVPAVKSHVVRPRVSIHCVPSTTSKRHDEQIVSEGEVADDEQGMTKNARAGNFVTVGNSGSQPWARLDRQPRTTRSFFPDEVMGGPGVEKSDERRRSHPHANLHGLAHGHAGHRMEGEYRRLRFPGLGCCPGAVSHGVVDLDTVDEEDAPAKPIVARRIFFIAIKTQPLTAPFSHLVLGETSRVARVAALPGGFWGAGSASSGGGAGSAAVVAAPEAGKIPLLVLGWKLGVARLFRPTAAAAVRRRRGFLLHCG